MRLIGLLAIVPVSMLLTVSFFVLLGAEKAASDALKKFGFAVAVVLWIASAVVLTGGIARTAFGGTMHHRAMMYHKMMHRGMCMTNEYQQPQELPKTK